MLLRLVRALAIVGLVACSNDRPPEKRSECPPQKECPQCEASTLKVKAACFQTNDRVVAHVAIETKYTKPRVSVGRDFWQLKCSKKTRECEGIHLDLDENTVKTGLPFLGADVMQGARLTAVQGEVATVTWGGLRTFTIDFADKKVRYAESGRGLSDEVEGRGEGACPGLSPSE